MHDNSPTCICYIINPAPHKVVEAGFDIARLTNKTCLPSVCICRQIQLRKIKTPGGILVVRLLVQARLLEGLLSTGPTPSSFYSAPIHYTVMCA